MRDRSSRPVGSPNRLPTKLERRIIALQFTRRWGPHRIAFHLHLARSTVGRVLARFRMPLLRNIDQATGLPVRRPAPVRYEKSRPGELVHVDIKKQGRIPDGVGWRVHGSREDLRALCNVSVGTLHEALRLLQSTGEITVRTGPGGGVFAGERAPPHRRPYAGTPSVRSAG